MSLLSSETQTALTLALILWGGLIATQYVFLGRPLERDIKNIEIRLTSEIKIAEIQRATDKKLVGHRLGNIEDTFNRMDSTLDSIDNKLDNINSSLDRMNNKLDLLLVHLLDKG